MYDPADTVNVPVPLIVPVPPAAVTTTVEVPPVHGIGVAVELATRSVGSVMVTEVVAVHWLASLTVYVYVPAPTVNGPVPLYGAVPPDGVSVTVEFPP